VARSATADLERLIRTHSLPKSTKQRFKRAVRPLARFPRLGPELGGRWSGFRFVLGPWRWMLVVYVHFESENRVVIVTIEDARSSHAARTNN
jgi:plasmid stabilization system protein ParE